MKTEKMTIENTLQKKYKGLSLVELVLYIFVMTLMIVSSTAVVASYMRGRSSIKKYQQGMEEMSLAMSNMSKTLRMSSCESEKCGMPDNGSKMDFKKNTDASTTYYYKFNSTEHKLQVKAGINGTIETIAENVGGKFSIQNADKIPLITIEMWKVDKNGNEKLGTRMQTSVSQRSGYEVP